MAAPDLVVCRCEEVTLAAIEAALAAGVRDAKELKLATRAGLGICQGRICRRLTETLLKAPPPSPGYLIAGYRLPVRPVLLAELADAAEEAADATDR